MAVLSALKRVRMSSSTIRSTIQTEHLLSSRYNERYDARMSQTVPSSDAGRRRAVLESALDTFARSGYRGTSMDAIARAARISRPGLYFLFDSKEALFREAAAHVLTQDLDAIELLLADGARPLADRVLDAFDRWAGRYVGPAAQDIPAVLAENPGLLDATSRTAPARFEAALKRAISEHSEHGPDIARTLGSVSVGLKHQTDSHDAYLSRLRIAIDLLLTTPRA
ncbi:TetR/AcrR family transcriptional regulator [Promicromonospora sp. NPDC019610]|uniref:TetR/AcrR family transcriptional regulator n=1 Tax=Promicromonospora sp. NPDC019610 TaxID=3364405 RepID=UPI003787F21C